MKSDVRHFYTIAEGVRIHALETGLDTHLTPVVMLHGLNDCHLTWKGVASRLATDRRVIMPDLPGHGLSDRPNASYELEWYARVMSRWLERSGLEKFDIVGHSLGGGVAQMLLLKCCERVRRLTLVSSGGLGREISPLLRLAAIPRVVEWLGQPFMSPCTRLALLRVLEREHIDELCAINANTGSARAFGRTVRDIISLSGQRRMFFQHAHEIEQLPPIALIWGDRDAIIPFDHAVSFAQLVEGVDVTVLNGCGHYPHHEEPMAFTRAVRAFLDAEVATPARLHDAGTGIDTAAASSGAALGAFGGARRIAARTVGWRKRSC